MKRLFFILFLSGTLLANGQKDKMRPRNEVNTDPSLVRFMAKLNHIIDTKNTKALLAVMDTDIKVSFGEYWGHEGFIEMWKPNNPKSGVWKLLPTLINMGGVWESPPDDSLFVFPYATTAEADSVDPDWVMVITDTNVNMREKPDKNAKVITRLSYNMVTEGNDPLDNSHPEIAHLQFVGRNKWNYVSTLDRKYAGYVYYTYIWSVIDYRLYLQKEKGKWSIRYFLDGD
jgi:hypothetical protein